ncbi:hypothetical protein DPEC_G00332800 [Dallia pectoralis]|uniref:Uncharacterized protein n=1 Tax=Dallia pectoralis TaxID=75939 RepID=A0ACC2F682_DALPE|nr:hypothetical protein DPEC_G00332800 [Dallia pectoralis]
MEGVVPPHSVSALPSKQKVFVPPVRDRLRPDGGVSCQHRRKSPYTPAATPGGGGGGVTWDDEMRHDCAKVERVLLSWNHGGRFDDKEMQEPTELP